MAIIEFGNPDVAAGGFGLANSLAVDLDQALAVQIGDYVIAELACECIRVDVQAAQQAVRVGAAGQEVTAGTADEDVRARAGIENVDACTADGNVCGIARGSPIQTTRPALNMP